MKKATKRRKSSKNNQRTKTKTKKNKEQKRNQQMKLKSDKESKEMPLSRELYKYYPKVRFARFSTGRRVLNERVV